MPKERSLLERETFEAKDDIKIDEIEDVLETKPEKNSIGMTPSKVWAAIIMGALSGCFLIAYTADTFFKVFLDNPIQGGIYPYNNCGSRRFSHDKKAQESRRIKRNQRRMMK